jgi:hypothetical protein
VAVENEVQKQGASYPYVPLTTALIVAEAVKQAGGSKAPVQKSVLASALKEDEKSQVFAFKIAATKCFGLIEGRSSFTLTENAKRYFYPISDSDRVDASFSFLASPSAFAEVIKRFDGGPIPPPEMLANIFHRELKVPESWGARAASYFIRSAQTVGAVDEKGFLRFNATRQSKGRISVLPPAEEKPSSMTINFDGYPGVPPKVHSEETKGTHQYVLPLQNGRQVILQAPLDINASEIRRLQKWIEFTLQLDWSDQQEKKE